MSPEETARRSEPLAVSVSVPSFGPAELVKLAVPLGILSFALWLLLFGPHRTHQTPQLDHPAADLGYVGVAANRP